MTKKIVIVEDEEKIAQLLSDYLSNEGYEPHIVNEGTAAVEYILTTAPDLVLLDIMLPGKDGLAICTEVRQSSMVPIFMLTAKVDEIDRLLGLNIGADDYICKPFSAREVVARVKALFRRHTAWAQPAGSDKGLSYRNIVLDVDKFRCEINTQLVELTGVEFRMLQTLMAHPGRVYSRASLMQSSYTDDRIVSDRTIDSHVKNLRKKMAAANHGDDCIQSIYGVGYKLQ